MIRGGRRYDAALHLLDRQVVDADGRLLAKVDDAELAEVDGGLVLSGLLCGPGALGPRIGGRLGAWTVAVWARLHPAPEPRPWHIPPADVEEIGSAVRVRSQDQLRRQGLESWLARHVVEAIPGSGAGEATAAPHVPAPSSRGPADGTAARHRLGDLLGGGVTVEGGPEGSAHVNDVRLEVVDGDLRVAGLVVGDSHAGSLLGYDRRSTQGPWLVAAVVRRLHRRAGYVPWRDVLEISWPEPGSIGGAARVRVSRVGALTDSS